MTENFTSIARPYAQAAYEYALQQNASVSWERFLQSAAMVAQDQRVVQLLADPKTNRQQLVTLFCDVLSADLTSEMKNFISLLAEHKRFPVLAEIASQFKTHCAEHEKKITVEVMSAIELDQQEKIKLTAALTKRLKLDVSINYSIDPTLIGGFVVRAGDKVIDGSIRGKLNRLVEFI